MFFGMKPFTARRARFHQKTRFGSLGIGVYYVNFKSFDMYCIGDAVGVLIFLFLGILSFHWKDYRGLSPEEFQKALS